MKRRNGFWGILILPAAVLVILIFLGALTNLDQGRRQQGMEQLEAVVKQGALACYAAEGVFPPSLEYLESRYGISVDHDAYLVIYEYIGSNLMPEITVLERD